MANKIPPSNILTYAALAFIAMAGLSYINFMPGVVNALAGGIGFSDAEAGQVVAMNGYGGILGSSIAIFLVRRIRWKATMLMTMGLLVIVDASSSWIAEYSTMLAWRFIAGVLGGLCVGIAFSVLARLDNPDRAFGLLLFIQFSIGSLVISLLPVLEVVLDSYAVFFVMSGFVLLSMIFLLLLPPLSADGVPKASTSATLGARGNSLLLLLAITAYQLAASAIWAYVGLIGLSVDISNEDVSLYIAVTGLLGLAGALLPVVSGNRMGRLYWVVTGVALSTASAIILNFSQMTTLYIGAMSLLFFSWPAIQSYLLAVTAELDSSGRLSTIASVVSSVGLATGPLLASFLLDEGDFSMMLYSCAVIFLLSFLLLLKPVQAQEKTMAPALS